MGIVCAMLALIRRLVIPHSPRPKFNDDLRFRQHLDLLGATAGISGLVLINFAWNQTAIVGWKTPYTYVFLIVGFLRLGAFALIERKSLCPLLPLSVFTGDLAWVLVCITACWSSFVSSYITSISLWK